MAVGRVPWRTLGRDDAGSQTGRHRLRGLVKGATEAQSFTLVAEDALWFVATGRPAASSGGGATADERAGASVGELAGGDDGLAGNDGLDVARRALHEAAGAAGEVSHQLGVQ